MFRESFSYASLRVKILTIEDGTSTLSRNFTILTLEDGIDTLSRNVKILTLEDEIDTFSQNLKILTLEDGIDTLSQNLKILTLEDGIDTLSRNVKVLTLDVGIDRLSRNVGTNQPTLCNNPKEQKPEGGLRGNALDLWSRDTRFESWLGHCPFCFFFVFRSPSIQMSGFHFKLGYNHDF